MKEFFSISEDLTVHKFLYQPDAKVTIRQPVQLVKLILKVRGYLDVIAHVLHIPSVVPTF